MNKDNILRSVKADRDKYTYSHKRNIDMGFCRAPLAMRTRGANGIRVYAMPELESDIKESYKQDTDGNVNALVFERYIVSRGPVKLLGTTTGNGLLLGFTMGEDTASATAISTDLKEPLTIELGTVIEARATLNFQRIIQMTRQVIEVFDTTTTDRYAKIKFALVQLTSPFTPVSTWKKKDSTPISIDPYGYPAWRNENFTEVADNYIPVSTDRGIENTTVSVNAAKLQQPCDMIQFGLDSGTSLVFWIDHPTEVKTFPKDLQFLLAWNYETKVKML